MGEGKIRVEKEELFAVVTIDNPPVNVLSTAMIQELGEEMGKLEADDDVRVVIITGAGNNAFAAGADVKEMAEIGIDKAYETARAGQEVFLRIERCEKPVIAAINGMALGGGNELAMACDLRVSSDRARFGNPEVGLGLIPGYGGTQRMTRLLGPAKAKELILTGRTIRADEALKVGLLNVVVPDGEELRAAKDLAMQIATKAPIAVQLSKKAINEGPDMEYEKAFEFEAQLVKQVSQTEDLLEGIMAFVEKRQPEFKGE
jgi:enoyl-CoA hydratase/carnithine racemase